jgi:uncharacterized membrane protein
MKALREILAASGNLFAIITLAFHYAELPQKVPKHFDAHGVVNEWGDKSSLWTLVGVACSVYLAMTLFRFLPAKAISLPVPAERRAAAMPVAFAMVGWMKAEMAWIFAVVTWSLVAVAQGRSKGLSPWFTPALLVTVSGTVAYYFWQMTRTER